MSVSPGQDTDSFKIFMQQHDRDAYNTFTTIGEEVKSEDSGLRPPSPPSPSKETKETRHGTTSRLFQVQQTRENKNVGSSSDTSFVLKEYEELQSVLEEMDDEEKELRQQITKDAEAHLEPTDYCLFEQLPPLWKQISKSGRNVGFQTLGHKGDPNRVYEFPQNERRELINALDTLSRETYGRGAERRPRITGMDREIHVILAKPIKDRPDWEAIHLDQFGRRIRFLAIERRSRTDTDDILETKLPAWMDSYFDTIIHNYSEVEDGAPTCFREYMEQADSTNPSKLDPVSDFFDADALNNILTEISSVSTFRSRPNNFIQQFGESTTRKKKFRFLVAGDQSTELHQRPKLPVIAPLISEREQPVQVCSIDVLFDHIPTVDVTKRVNRTTRVVQEPSSSSQPMLTSASEDEVELRGPSLDETPPPQPPRRRVSSEEPLRLEDLQASRNILDMSIASSLQRHVDSQPRSAEYKAPHLSEKDPLNKMCLVSFLLKFQTWDKYGCKIAYRSFQAPGQSDWSRAMLIATQIFGEGKTQITPELLSSLPSHIREEIDRDMKQPLLRIDPQLTKRLGPPIHHYDLFRSMMISTCPSGLSSMVDPHLISRWQGQGLLRPDFSDADLMVFLLRRTQFTSYHEACSALAKPCINWRNIHNKMDADNEFGRFEDFGDVLRMTTYMVDHSISVSIRGSSGLITLSPALIAEYFRLGIDNSAITKELASHWTREDLWDPSTGTTL
ncbi:hypothetical protein P9112_011303 [Eukaryota sp. TZLM1-RC]